MESAAKKVPLTMSAQVPSGKTSRRGHAGPTDAQVVENDEDWRDYQLNDGHEEEVHQNLGEEER